MWFFIHLVLVKSGRYHLMLTCKCKVLPFTRSRGKNVFPAPTPCDLHKFCFTLCKVQGLKTFPNVRLELIIVLPHAPYFGNTFMLRFYIKHKILIRFLSCNWRAFYSLSFFPPWKVGILKNTLCPTLCFSKCLILFFSCDTH